MNSLIRKGYYGTKKRSQITQVLRVIGQKRSQMAIDVIPSAKNVQICS